MTDGSFTDDAEVVEWVRTASGSEIYTHRAAVRSALAALVDAERWEEVIDVARLVEMPMARGARWGTWRVVLEHALVAARASGDRSSEAWALHQLGSRAMIMDDLETARVDLHAALQHREALGETEAAAVTRQNLRILPLALSGVMTVLTLLVGLAALAIPVLDDPEIGEKTRVLDISDEVIELTGGETSVTVELVNLGSLTLSGLRVSPDLAEPASLARCAELKPGGECILEIDVTDIDAGLLLVEIEFAETDDSSESILQSGDDRVLIVRRSANE